ncbi:MAG TPA: formylglycine-generating enzyme family protein [Gemmataceae bacterium]|nr:formylglycine-generating enzyme family protein [Gemmataceae bacterium]
MKHLIRKPLAFAVLLLPFVGLALWLPAPAADKATELPQVETATHKGYTEKIAEADVAFDMVAVPGGTFLMGSPKDEKGRGEDEGPQHPVKVRPFWMSACEVTWDIYDPWWKQKPGNKEEQRAVESGTKKVTQKEADAISRPTPTYADPTFSYGHDGFAALSITHHAAMDYCRWLSQTTGKDYRLPTEAEWEWACRAGSKTAYSFGDNPDALKDYAWYADNADEAPHKVGTRKPNAWGLYDMHGNVGEWCIDVYKKDFYATLSLDKPTLGPVNLPTGVRYGHVVRGGSWADKAAGLRSAVRRFSEKGWNKQDPQQPKSIWWLTDGDIVGFRVVRAVEEYPDLKGLRSKIKWESK